MRVWHVSPPSGYLFSRTRVHQEHQEGEKETASQDSVELKRTQGSWQWPKRLAVPHGAMPAWMDPWPRKDSGWFSLTRWMKVPNHTESGVRRVRKQKHVFLILALWRRRREKGWMGGWRRWWGRRWESVLSISVKAPKEDLKRNIALWGERWGELNVSVMGMKDQSLEPRYWVSRTLGYNPADWSAARYRNVSLRKNKIKG